ncbi:MAG TPA: beta-ketoacyl-[acyl-carrier-protein] synthase family protein [Spongiibacteraceae bacterium]|nr:beta-ketoacyl-[acyl-carrier-protein] synthase family protein [Spongiibacteraceae bacterium]
MPTYTSMNPLQLSCFTLTTSLGAGLDANLQALQHQRSGLAPCTFETVQIDTAIGAVAGLDAIAMRSDLSAFDCRNNRLAQQALTQDNFATQVHDALAHYAANRVGVFVGTSTAGILETELAYRQRDPQSGLLLHPPRYRYSHNSYSSADFVRRYFGLTGPAATISTACSSSAKVFATAQRMIDADLIDAAIVGGVDSLCLTTLYGFSSLQLTSPQPCRPFDAQRDGISIGEGAAFILLERAVNSRTDNILLLGVGESSDAYHMSSPHPEGRGAQQAMQAALARAGLTVDAIDYINLHGTATPSNDAAEGFAVAALFGARTPASSTKGATGHTLGAAGAVEAAIGALALMHDFIPAGANTRSVDPALPIDYVLENRRQPLRHVLSNSFGFGGTNCSLILGKSA